MSDSSIYVAIAMSLAVVLGVIGAVQVIGPKFVRDAYRNWGYPQKVRVLTGLLDIAAALMLVEPSLRGWGIALAAVLSFGSVVIFLNHRQYRYALPTIALMVALVPAAVAIPRPEPIQFVSLSDVAEEAPQTLASADVATKSAVE